MAERHAHGTTTFLALPASVVADAIGAMRAGWTVGIVAAFRAGSAGFGRAADEIGAAFDRFLTRIGFAKSAVVALFGAAGSNGNTFTLAAFLVLAAFARADASGARTTLAAIAIVTAFRAVPAFTRRAAEEIVTTIPLCAGTAGDQAGIARVAATRARGDAFALAAFLILGARAAALSLDANLASTRTTGIAAAFGAVAPAVGAFAAFLLIRAL